MKPRAREVEGAALEVVRAGCHQQIEAQAIVDPHSALRYRKIKTELQEDHQDGYEYSPQSQGVPALLMEKDAPGHEAGHDPSSTGRVSKVDAYASAGTSMTVAAATSAMEQKPHSQLHLEDRFITLENEQ
jgi:hypothetical protein